MVERFFRLGRSRDHLIKLVSEFSTTGIHFKALDLGVDSTTPAGKMVLQIFAALSEYDRESILEKTRQGNFWQLQRASTLAGRRVLILSSLLRLKKPLKKDCLLQK